MDSRVKSVGMEEIGAVERKMLDGRCILVAGKEDTWRAMKAIFECVN